jgi:hypothetical protein
MVYPPLGIISDVQLYGRVLRRADVVGMRVPTKLDHDSNEIDVLCEGWRPRTSKSMAFHGGCRVQKDRLKRAYAEERLASEQSSFSAKARGTLASASSLHECSLANNHPISDSTHSQRNMCPRTMLNKMVP